MQMLRFLLFTVIAMLCTGSTRAATLRVAIPALPATLGVPFTAAGQPSNVTWAALFDGLTAIDANGIVEPALAQSWTLVNPHRWQFKLRPNLHFHDGTPVTAEAVGASLEVLRAPAGHKFYIATEVANITALRAVDPLTLEVDTRTPDAILPRRLSIVPIVSAAAWQAKGESGFAKEPVGTGPYRLVNWGTDSGSAKFAAADSWRKPQTMDALELVPLDNPISRLQALLSGRVDAVTRLNVDDIADTKAAGFSVVSHPAPQVMTLAFRIVGNEKSPVADVRVRCALSLAINRQAMAQQIFLGTVTPANQSVTSGTAGYDPNLPPAAYDPQQAKALLADAGYPKGFHMIAEVMIGASPADDLVYQQVAQDLAKIGVTLTLHTIPYASWLRELTSGEWGTADAFSIIWDSTSYYDASRMMNVASCRKPAAFFCDQASMPLFAAVDDEIDEGQRLVKLRALEDRYADLVAALWLVSTTQYYAYARRLANVQVRNSGLIYEHITLNP